MLDSIFAVPDWREEDEVAAEGLLPIKNRNEKTTNLKKPSIDRSIDQGQEWPLLPYLSTIAEMPPSTMIDDSGDR
jgi:hypothetical protein